MPGILQHQSEQTIHESTVNTPALFGMQAVLPCAEYYRRQGFQLKKIVQFAANRDFSDLLVFNEDRKEVNGVLHVHLPDGPTAHYRISNMVLGKDIKVCFA
eukprot:GHRR01029119.1.p2 GENE.GHRR01029119.1~~GHRR01029119.1.p2  ORF type:complete len:101 (-),score=26.28 GHRR01029119.1:512-814(-)